MVPYYRLHCYVTLCRILLDRTSFSPLTHIKDTFTISICVDCHQRSNASIKRQKATLITLEKSCFYSDMKNEQVVTIIDNNIIFLTLPDLSRKMANCCNSVTELYGLTNGITAQIQCQVPSCWDNLK